MITFFILVFFFIVVLNWRRILPWLVLFFVSRIAKKMEKQQKHNSPSKPKKKEISNTYGEFVEYEEID